MTAAPNSYNRVSIRPSALDWRLIAPEDVSHICHTLGVSREFAQLKNPSASRAGRRPVP